MTNHEHTHNQEPALPAQAKELLGEVGTLTTFQGKNYGDRNTVSVDVPTMPSEIAIHLPELHDPSSEVSDSAYIEQMFDQQTGQPRREGIVGMATFTRKERVDQNLMYATHVNYHIKTQDGETYGLERHVTNTEHGAHKVRGLNQMKARAKADTASFALDMLGKLMAEKRNVEATRPMEQAMGMFDVTKDEAQQIIDFVRGLNEAEK